MTAKKRKLGTKEHALLTDLLSRTVETLQTPMIVRDPEHGRERSRANAAAAAAAAQSRRVAIGMLEAALETALSAQRWLAEQIPED
ncbi:MAG TPA: hypothetical protein VFN67_36400 [Polyangiales bacterium]|nr:hypothetical protein [Polyangiales bacterium]